MRKVLFILSELADSDVDWMVRNGTKRAVAPGTVLIREGEQLPVLFVLLDGRLEVTLATLGGRRIALLGSGEILGELSFLDSRPPSATVTALDHASVLSISRARLNDKLSQDPGFAARFYRALGVFLASRLRRSQSRLGYGEDVADERAEPEDEIDPALLDGLALAGARFDWMLKRLRAAPSEPGAGGAGDALR
jgi:bacteriocin-type transport-associated protein